MGTYRVNPERFILAGKLGPVVLLDGFEFARPLGVRDFVTVLVLHQTVGRF